MRKVFARGDAAYVASNAVIYRGFVFFRTTLRKLKEYEKNVMHSNSVNEVIQRRHYVLKRTANLNFCNITENTLADTPSGYIQDPANRPKKMVTYKKTTQEGQTALEEMEREYELMHREELLYNSHTTIVIQKWKEIVLQISST
ncbi:hypothetical protein TraAM80_06747 [Trypanosoma rangeli]|uniref:Uncharacterized protein n=1 Tax=Trypanosoma rangeli TaxID=5698 RepID=A0A422N917_TRYRA|nr:uncharacterized protein TraAM80_06747 [Trypanosoma rangeli]RNF01943.1 hypothetical protein TraAM80_06747 [Trypanosoma rangeli]|eukprot:RNF01943.1 hypothetical protein TraAM80_06747 [Trypanosoma rangeli]